MPEERTEENPLGLYALSPGRIRNCTEQELGAKRLDVEATRCARFRELYARLGFRTAVHTDGTMEITVGSTNTNGVM